MGRQQHRRTRAHGALRWVTVSTVGQLALVVGRCLFGQLALMVDRHRHRLAACARGSPWWFAVKGAVFAELRAGGGSSWHHLAACALLSYWCSRAKFIFILVQSNAKY
ncbi:oxidoreductase [Sesbania bispinosa]|nr:oxidoreductase [Sesbania bispinosa]